MKRKIFALLTAVLLIVTSAPITMAVFVEEPTISYINSYYDKNGVYREEYVEDDTVTSSSDYYADVTEDEHILSSSELPSTWDSRKYGWVTPVKNQGAHSTCWAFAICSTAETSLIKQGYTDNSIDLSEAHLARFQDAYVENSDMQIQKDRLTFNPERNPFLRGGSFHYATAAIARGSGLTTEEKFPYNMESSNTMQFSNDDMFESDYTIENAKSLYTSNEIKQAIVNSGSVCLGIYLNEIKQKYLADKTAAYYQNVETGNNHAVTIVGWDDNFSTSNFNQRYAVPNGNGAWLCKNSWGTSGLSNGYMWVSYEDTSISYAVEYTVKPTDYDYIYQYNGNHPNGGFQQSSAITVANVFTSTGDNTITGVGFNTSKGHYICTISLYTNLTDSSSPIGTLLETITYEAYNNGYYTASFENQYKFPEGQKFSLVIEYANQTKKAASSAPCEMKSSACSYYIENGQSFYCVFGDIYNDVTEFNVGNFSIKALAVADMSTPGDNSGNISDITESDSIKIDKLPTKTNYIIGETFDCSGLIVSHALANGSTEPIDNYTISEPDMTCSGVQTVTVSYGLSEASFEIYITNVNDLIINNNIYINYSNDIISGFNPGFKSLNNYFNTNSTEYTYRCSSYGTGGTISIYHNNEFIHSFQILIYGDINGDGLYNAYDAILLKSLIAGNLKESNIGNVKYLAADCNHDNIINNLDVELIEEASIFANTINQNSPESALQESSD